MASKFQDNTKTDLLNSLKSKEEERFVSGLAKEYGIKYIAPNEVYASPDVLPLITEDDARKAEVAAFKMRRRDLHLAVFSPKNPHLEAVLEKLKERGYSLSIYMASKSTLERMWRLYSDISTSIEVEEGVISISSEKSMSVSENVKDIHSLRDMVQKIINDTAKQNATNILDTLIAGGTALKSSDIHIEPSEDNVRIRYRIDGILVDLLNINHSIFQRLASRIKLIGGMKLNINSGAQDGRFSIRLDGVDMEVRISTIPGPSGEAIVMRLLDPRGLTQNIDNLGFEDGVLKIVREEINRPNGIIITTGPTGSGKTTTLYSFLKEVHNPNIKIITLEDPIEYHLDGIVQTQIKGDKYTFASGLRAILRQDPDVIMVGEIRDLEVAKTAINASLTGHLVFSTLHTNSASGAFSRLIDIGIDRKLISASVNLIIAQRLVRRLKKENAVVDSISEEDKTTIRKIFEDAPQSIKDRVGEIDFSTFMKPRDDLKDSSDGYKGRLGIFETIFMDENIEKVLYDGGSTREISEAAKKQGTPTIVQDAIMKVMEGLTSLSEIKRIIDINEPR
ncbi:MAG: GspE/PulE family protein [Candidatus Campbellbacteria bacterium]|nr:GspE/PulE family protein [Candidatus Campbellbacteria bacterium]